MQKRLLIHGGVHQTGVALVKNFLHAQSKELAARGVVYPVFGADSVSPSASHLRLVWDIHTKKLDLASLQDWARSLSKGDGNLVILSAEDFCRLRDLSFLDRLVEYFDVEVAFYIRRQDSWINSWYNQNIKWPFDARLCRCSPIEFLEHLDEFYWIRYYETVTRWSQRLGPDRVHVRVVEPGQVEDPVADFCLLMGVTGLQVPASEIGAKEERLNGSLSNLHLELLRRLGTLKYADPVRNKITNAARRAIKSTNTNVYGREIRQLIIDRYAAQNEKLARQHLGRSEGELFRDASFPADPDRLEQGIHDTVIYEFIRKLISEFNPHIGDN